MASKDEITISTKLKIDVADKLKEQARSQGVGVNHLVKDVLMGLLEPKLEGVFDEDLKRVAGNLGTDTGTLIQIMEFLISKGYIYRDEAGILKYKNYGIEPDYVSVDKEIDAMKLTPKQRNYMKNQILHNITKFSVDDGLGNGAGV